MFHMFSAHARRVPARRVTQTRACGALFFRAVAGDRILVELSPMARVGVVRFGRCCRGHRPLLGGVGRGSREGHDAGRFEGAGVGGVSVVSGDRSVRVAVAFARETARSPTARLCTACVEVLAVSGAGITLMGGNQAGPICVSDSSVAALEDLQFTLGQGPCRDAFRSRRSVHAPRFDDSASARWPPFVDLARASGFGAVFAYPLLADDVNVGVLTLYQQCEGELSQAQHDDSVAVTRVLTETVLSLQDTVAVGGLAAELDVAVAYRAEIYQASGMVAVQLQIHPDEALIRIRGHAFAHDIPVSAVAEQIVARRLHLPDDRLNREGRE